MKAACLFATTFLLLACEPMGMPDHERPPSGRPADRPNPFNPASLIGLPLAAAQAAADRAGIPHRVIERDGRSFPRTMDYHPERLNFSVVRGRVVKVTRE